MSLFVVARELLAACHEVRTIVRSADKAEPLKTPDAELLTVEEIARWNNDQRRNGA